MTALVYAVIYTKQLEIVEDLDKLYFKYYRHNAEINKLQIETDIREPLAKRVKALKMKVKASE